LIRDIDSITKAAAGCPYCESNRFQDINDIISKSNQSAALKHRGSAQHHVRRVRAPLSSTSDDKRVI